MTIAGVQQRTTDPAFRHEALFYGGAREFHAAALSFIRDGLARGEPVMVAVSAAKITGLRRSLGADAGRVRFADMAQIGTNPARIIPAWRAFVSEHAGAGRVRGIGEPAWAGRSPAELIECQAHEELLNRAFAGSPPWWLLCPVGTGGPRPGRERAGHQQRPPWRGAGTVRSWRDGDELICEARDRGRLGNLLVGREAPDTGAERGRGLWLVNQLCPLVQILSSAAGTVARLHMRDRPA